jgi:hypothetical protein
MPGLLLELAGGPEQEPGCRSSRRTTWPVVRESGRLVSVDQSAQDSSNSAVSISRSAAHALVCGSSSRRRLLAKVFDGSSKRPHVSTASAAPDWRSGRSPGWRSRSRLLVFELGNCDRPSVGTGASDGRPLARRTDVIGGCLVDGQAGDHLLEVRVRDERVLGSSARGVPVRDIAARSPGICVTPGLRAYRWMVTEAEGSSDGPA